MRRRYNQQSRPRQRSLSEFSSLQLHRRRLLSPEPTAGEQAPQFASPTPAHRLGSGFVAAQDIDTGMELGCAHPMGR
ncbi:hypothetical protein QFZ74_004773 [Streptomyces sp. V3I7]|nr:hypothetical protein [Streptomyces sp. V3I7]